MTGADRRRFDDAATAAAGTVMRRYSTSFSRATALLREPDRSAIRTVYALVRVADEIVDGSFDAASAAGRRRLLDGLEKTTQEAMATGYATDLIVHAFAATARRCGITADLTRPFFASMRTDLDRADHDEESLARYVHGSAEVVGLMCLRVFLADAPDREERYERLAPGAVALGAAFQKVNFLRDLAADRRELDRAYLPGTAGALTDADRDRVLDDIDADLALARSAALALPRRSRRGVLAAHGLFAALSHRLRRTPARVIAVRRVRVPAPAKAAVLLGALGTDLRHRATA